MRVSLFHKILVVVIVILRMFDCDAQTSFQYKAGVSDVKSAGFYKIILSPAIVSKCKNDLNDIRIVNENASQSPYVLKSDQLQFKEKNFLELPIIDIKKEADKLTHITIRNNAGITIDQLVLVIKNTDAQRTVTVSGSDDQQKWFVVKENIELNNIFIQDQDRSIQSLVFPKSTYKFFEIIINGKDSLPINIVKVGLYEGVLRTGNFLNVPDPIIHQVDSSNKSSYIDIVFNENYLLNKIQLDIQGPRFFKRNLVIYKKDNNGFTAINDYTLSSAIEHGYTINAKTKKLRLIIENEDSPPLKVVSVKAYQINKYLLAYLEPSNKYELLFGDSMAGAPRYDLEFFKDSINNTPVELSIGAVTNINVPKGSVKPTGNGNMMILWIIIVSVLVLLLVLTLRMTKEVSKKDTNEQV